MRHIALIVLFSVAHAAVTFACFFIAYSGNVIDGRDATLVQEVSALFLDVLINPGAFVQKFASFDDGIEWSVFIGNSLLWGGGINLLIMVLKSGSLRQHDKSPTPPDQQ